MVDVRPFRGLRYSADRVRDLSLVLAPPYDVISAEERSRLLDQSPLNIVRVELPDGHYDGAASELEAWRASGVLVRDESPAFYLYEVRFRLGGEERARRSLAVALRLEPWESGQVLPHERTMSAPKEDRLRLLRATRTNISPIWALFRGEPASLTRAWEWADARPADGNCQLEDGTAHCLWVLDDAELVAALHADFAGQRLVIADGHHRYETALRYRDELAEAGGVDSAHPARFVMAHLVAESDPGLAILPTHRLVRGLGDIDQVELETEIGRDWHGEYFPLWEDAPPEQLKALLEQLYAKAETGRAVGLFGPDTSLFSVLILRNKELMEQRAPDRSQAWRDLEVALLDEGILKPLLEQAGVDREDAVSYERDPYEALQSVLRGDHQLALFLNGTRADQVLAVAEAGDRMPEKSTYFYPKLPTGLVLREFC